MPCIVSTYLSLGSNLGDRRLYLQKAMNLLSANGACLEAVSSIWETAAWGYSDERSYYNIACKYSTQHTAHELIALIEAIERQLGRTVKNPQHAGYAAREIDIDILFFGDQRIHTLALEVPHPRLQLRNFVLQPMVEIAPDLKHPVSGFTMSELLQRSPDQSLGLRLDEGV